MAGNLKFLVKLTKSRIEKGFLAFPRRLRYLFPSTPRKVEVFLDDGQTPQQKPYTPYESTTRECRIYNLRSWFQKHKAAVGDWVEVVVEATGYRFLFRRRSEEEAKYRQQLQSAETEKQAEDALKKLAQARQRSVERVALKELDRLSRQVWERKRVTVALRNRYEGVPASLRTVLKIVYGGRCQICGFTFLKRDGDPYFEVHHVDPDAGHQPQNLLVLCPNCHAQMEHADVIVKRNEQGWVVAVVINGEERPVYQAILSRPTHPISSMLLPLLPLLAFSAAVKIFVA